MSFLTSIHDLSVFVVEPSAVQSQFIELYLKKIGVMSTTIFRDGNSVLTAMQSNLPQVVISAMHLPDMTGGDLVGHMRANELTSGVAFILVSSETNPHYLEPVRQNGSSAILGKPFTIEQLKTALATTLDYLNPDADKIHVSSEIDLEAINVLLVDDSHLARGFIRRVLENLGIQKFTEAENGKQATELIEEHYFDLVVTDYNMPEMDGRELTNYIRTQSWQSSVPILMVTSEQNESRLAAVEQAGVSGVCDKPFETAVVRKLLEQMLRTD
ncbi:MAG: response regulator [Gammaproteobacteria bacterium]|nr:response regulator [Gammaproteobacteria bacterium]MBU1624978.1 response regulator [Gammaproteobacteria bacterium]MBU1981238.1 response regulator [Gammaproteobacteria bacterium]